MTDRVVTFPRVLRSEWIKFWTLRSTWWSLGIALVVMVGFAIAFAAAITALISSNPEAQAGIEAEGGLSGPVLVTGGYAFAALVLAVLGSMSITGEYSTGMIRSTAAAVPTRLPALAAKAVVVAVVALVVSALGTAIAYLVTLPILDGTTMAVDLGDEEQVRALAGVPLYVTVVVLFALAVGTLLRHTAGSIVLVAAVFFLIPTIIAPIAQITGTRWLVEVNKWWPSAAGERVIVGGDQDTADFFAPWTGLGVLALYTVVLLVAAAVAMRTRDA